MLQFSILQRKGREGYGDSAFSMSVFPLMTMKNARVRGNQIDILNESDDMACATHKSFSGLTSDCSWCSVISALSVLDH